MVRFGVRPKGANQAEIALAYSQSSEERQIFETIDKLHVTPADRGRE
jgi:hypothetical protein